MVTEDEVKRVLQAIAKTGLKICSHVQDDHLGIHNDDLVLIRIEECGEMGVE